MGDNYRRHTDAERQPVRVQRTTPFARGLQHQKRSRLDTTIEWLVGRRERPGEQTIIRSPVVLLLASTTLGAAALSLILWTAMAATIEERCFNEAMLFYEQEKFIEAEQSIQSFLQVYPNSAFSKTARITLQRARFEAQMSQKTPDVQKALKELEMLGTVCRDSVHLTETREDLRRSAERLSAKASRLAERQGDPSLLDVSRKALQIREDVVGKDGATTEEVQKLLDLQAAASNAVNRKKEFDSSVNTIERYLESGDTTGAVNARFELIEKFQDLKDDQVIQGVLERIIEAELRSIEQSDMMQAARNDSGVSSEETVLTALMLRTLGEAEEISQGRIVCSCNSENCVALDADSGTPVWTRHIGSDSPFPPVLMKSPTAGVLVFSTSSSELLLLSPVDGHLLWRQRCDSRPSSSPLIINQLIYLTTTGNEVLKISAFDGQAISKLKFRQPLIGPPSVLPGDGRMFISGDAGFVYGIDIESFRCVSVAVFDHAHSSIKSPLIPAGRYLLMFDNPSRDAGRVRALVPDNQGRLSIVATESVDGMINDRSVLWGRNLFVPSTPQRVTAFTVTDAEGEPPFTRVGMNLLEDGRSTSMFLTPGAGGQLWLAGRDLRKFRCRANSLLLEPDVGARGIHLQPIQTENEAFFVTTRNPGSTSVFMTRVTPDQLQGSWRTAIESRLIAVAPAGDKKSLLALADYGVLYRILLDDISKRKFITESHSQYQLPELLSTSVDGLNLQDGRMIAWCGGPEPAVWSFTDTGTLERKWPLTESPEVPPVAIEGGVVFGLPGALLLTATSGENKPTMIPFLGTAQERTTWQALIPLSKNRVLGITSDHHYFCCEYKTSGKPQLTEVTRGQLPSDIRIPPVSLGDSLLATTSDGKLLQLSAADPGVIAEHPLKHSLIRTPIVTGDQIFAETTDGRVLVFHFEDEIEQTGAFGLEGFRLVGAPVRRSDGGFVAARSDGTLIGLNADGSETGSTRSIQRSLRFGPIVINDHVLAVSADGCISRFSEDVFK